MGFYVQTDNPLRKTEYLVLKRGGRLIDKPKTFSDIPEDKALIVIVDNGIFEAAGLAYSQAEFESFTLPTDHRQKKYVLLEKKLAHTLAGYDEEKNQQSTQPVS